MMMMGSSRRASVAPAEILEDGVAVSPTAEAYLQGVSRIHQGSASGTDSHNEYGVRASIVHRRSRRDIRYCLTPRPVSSRFPNMRHLVWTALILFAFGCQGDAPFPRSETDTQLFGPVAMRLHPIFTQVKDWTGDNKPDGIEALVELQDQFGDPTKASGRIIFELFEYKPYEPERRGERVCNPWIGYLETLDEQRERWNRTSRTYGFQLAYDQLILSRTYVLTAEFQLGSGGRFFDRIILEGQKPEAPSTMPTTPLESFAATTRPATNPASPPVLAPSGAPNAGPGPRSPEP